MPKLKLIIYLSLWGILFSSCELLGIGGNDDNGVSGGEVVWQLENQQENIVRTQPAIDLNKTYFLQDGFIKSATLNKGNIIWSNKLVNQGSGAFSRKIIQTTDRIFIDLGSEIRAYDKQDGNLIWDRIVSETSSEFSGLGGPVMSQDKNFIYAGRREYVVKVHKSDGQIARHYPLDRLVPEDVTQGSTEPIISPFGDDILYVPASYYDRTTPGEEEFGGNMFAFEASTGKVIWQTRVEYAVDDTRTEMPGDSVTVSPPIYDIEVTESYIIALQGRAIVALNRTTGQIQWYNNFPESGFDVGLTVQGNGIYAASVGSFAHKLDLHTGEELWRRDIRFSNTSIPTVQNGRLYFNNSGGGGIWVLDTDDGSVIYNQNTPNYRQDNFDVYISSLGVGEGYMVNVGSKAVYCLKVP